MKSLNNNLCQAQNQQNMYTNHHKIERIFEVGDMVFMSLQPNKKSSFKERRSKNIKIYFYEPYKILRRIGEASYKLKKSKVSKIHITFHVYCLKCSLGKYIIFLDDLPLIDEGNLILILEVVMDVREWKIKHKRTKDYLV